MSDAAFSAARRRHRSTGAPSDEAVVLKGRLRAGQLSESRLQLAAFVGHEPARWAVDGRAPATPDLPEQVPYGLVPWGKAAVIRAGLVGARLVAPLLDEAPPGLGKAVSQEAQAWLEDRWETLYFRALARSLFHPKPEAFVRPDAFAAEQALVAAGAAVHALATVHAAGNAACALARTREALVFVSRQRSGRQGRRSHSRRVLGEVRHALRQDLTAWALAPGPLEVGVGDRAP
jgi:hypothetical protein